MTLGRLKLLCPILRTTHLVSMLERNDPPSLFWMTVEVRVGLGFVSASCRTRHSFNELVGDE
jgi:hypothetical protein